MQKELICDSFCPCCSLPSARREDDAELEGSVDVILTVVKDEGGLHRLHQESTSTFLVLRRS